MDELAGRMAQLDADHQAWLADYREELRGAASEPAPQDVAQGQAGRFPTGSPPSRSGGPGPAQPDHAAELAEADRIKSLTMREFAQERQRHIRPSSGLF
jgi:hypothetical protein